MVELLACDSFGKGNVLGEVFVPSEGGPTRESGEIEETWSDSWSLVNGD